MWKKPTIPNERDEHWLIPLLLVGSCVTIIALFYFANQFVVANRMSKEAIFNSNQADYFSLQALIMFGLLLLQIGSIFIKRRGLHLLTLVVSAFFLLNIFYRWL